MDWITFIKWNGIVYATYYGTNLLVDYLQTRREFTPKPSYTEYQLEDLGIEAPRTIRSSDFLHVNKEQDGVKAETPSATKQEKSGSQFQFNAPIERQGIPLKEFIKIAGKSGNKIFQPTI